MGKPNEIWATALLSKASLGLAWLLVLVGIATALWTAWLVYTTFSPVIFWDQWTIVNDLIHSHGHMPWAQLWAQHNEHRIPWGRLACYADLMLFGGRNISLLIEIYMIQALESAVLIWMFHRYSGLGPAEVLTAAGFFIFCLFYPIQIENFYWGFQVSFVLLPFCSSLAFAAAIVHSDQISCGTRRWFSGALLLCLASAIAGEFSLASGLLVWLLLPILGFSLRMPRKTQYLVASVGATAMAVFFWGFHFPGQTANPLQSARHPIAVFRYIRTYFAWAWDPSVPSSSVWPSIAESVATFALGGVLIASLWLLKKRSSSAKLQTFLVMNALFILLTSAVTALGRLNFGVSQATSGRYQTAALVFWACICGLVLVWRAGAGAPAARLVEIQVALLLLILACGARFDFAKSIAEAHQASLAQAYAELAQNPSDIQAHSQLSPYPNLDEEYQFLRSHHWGPTLQELGVIQGSMVPITPLEMARLRVNGFPTVPSTQCAGYLDHVRGARWKTDRVTATGWAWDLRSGQRPTRVILALEDGTIAGTARVNLPRSDVKEQVPQVTALETGWSTEALLPPGATLRAFVVLADSKSACPLANEFRRE